MPPTSAPATAAAELLNQGITLLKTGQYATAAACLRSACGQDPGNAQAHYQLGNSLRLSGDYQAAAEALNQATLLDPALHDAWFSLAFLHFQQGQFQLAADSLGRMCNHFPNDFDLHHKAAGLLSGFGQHEMATTLYEHMVSIDPDQPVGHLQLGIQYQKSGRYTEAAEQFQQAISLAPGHGPPYMLLANTRRMTDADSGLCKMFERAIAQPGLSDDARACIGFGLGKIYDDLGHYDRAFEQYRTANSLRRQQVVFSQTGWSQFVERLIHSFGQVDFGTKPARSEPTPGYIVGMLRSGTTLVERLLGNHPAAQGCGESELLDTFIQRIAELKSAPYPECILQLDAEELAAIATDFRRQIATGKSQATLLLDKNPLNFVHVGLIALLFPDAPIIHCRRNTLDTCLSIYFQNFAHASNNYAYDMDDIAAFYAGYERLMRFWESLLPRRLIPIQYEALVSDPETTAQSLYSAVGLTWEPKAIEPQANPATISTASVWQARQPIYSHSVDRWRHYEQHLSELHAALNRHQPTRGNA